MSTKEIVKGVVERVFAQGDVISICGVVIAAALYVDSNADRIVDSIQAQIIEANNRAAEDRAAARAIMAESDRKMDEFRKEMARLNERQAKVEGVLFTLVKGE